MIENFGTRLAALQSRTRNFVNSMAHDFHLAEDIAGDAITLAWQHRDRFQDRGPSSLKNWVFMIARNCYLSHRRAQNQQRYGGSADDLLPVQMPWISAHQEDRLHLQDVDRALSRIPTEYREAVIQVALGDQYNEAAVVLGCAEGTLKSRVHRGRHMLAGELRL